jgi:ABC-2 type transport system ATP-binding protein
VGGDESAIHTHALTKRYRGGQLAVDGLDLTVPAGSVFGFLGPNGSGKTTTIRMLMGLIEPTSGSARVLGRPMPRASRAVLPHVGALIEGPALYGFLSGRDNLVRYDAADPTADPRTRNTRVAAALDRVGLGAAAGKKAKAYSLGMKQRLGLAAALLTGPEVLILDEPTNGMDPNGVTEMRRLLRELADTDGVTVILSSHNLDEVQRLCDRVAIMDHGRILALDTPAGLKRSLGADTIVRVGTAGDLRKLATVLAAMEGARSAHVSEGGVLLYVSGPVAYTLPRIFSAAAAHGFPVTDLSVTEPTLEAVFITLTGKELRD